MRSSTGFFQEFRCLPPGHFDHRISIEGNGVARKTNPAGEAMIDWGIIVEGSESWVEESPAISSDL